MLKPGLYEKVINLELGKELNALADQRAQTAPIDQAESAKVLSGYISEVIERGLCTVRDHGGDAEEKLNRQIALVNRIIETIQGETDGQLFSDLAVDARSEQLLALVDAKDSVFALQKKLAVPRPETSLAQSSLFTGAVQEPQMFSELKKEILSCDRIDMLVSFIKWSGLRLLMDELRAFTQKGGQLRIITTSYMGATDVKAVEELSKLSNTTIKISYNTKQTRLHAKAYIFYRDTGFTTAYVGSSNISNAALSSGLEWNLKITQQDQASTLDKISASFESYWESSEFEYYAESQQERLARALKAEHYVDLGDTGILSFDIRPYSYQQEILDALHAERMVRNQWRNLVVAATGTGKTVISAFDYKNFLKSQGSKGAKLLFVAHREEILKQSLYTFRHVLKDQNFGDLFVGSQRPEGIDHLFISIQTFNSQDFTEKTSPEFYDYIIVDEFHHAAAPTYQTLLNYYQPKVLLGLTATPERMDGKSILRYFNDRIAAEIRLPEAIDRKLLSPFQYFGVTDDIDLTEIKWQRGGYDRGALSRLYLSGYVAERRADSVVQATVKYVTDMQDVRGLGFCVSIEHAEFMADFFCRAGIPSMALTGQSPETERNEAKKRLVSGQVRFIFVVDIYNEGVDIPEVNTVLFLRPTESLTVFLQQLGRGLRLAEGKECLTVLDFIGAANKKYNFADKFTALLADPSRSIEREVKDGFLSLPKGCYIQLERKAYQHIINNIKASFGARRGLISAIASFQQDTDQSLTLGNVLEHFHLDPRSIYAKDSFAQLCVDAGVQPEFHEELDELMHKALGRFTTTNSRRFIQFALRVLAGECWPFSQEENQMLQMIQFTIWQKSAQDCGFTSAYQGIERIRSCPIFCQELMDLLSYNFEKIDFIDQSPILDFSCPLDVYCNYTRDQVLVALDFMKPATVREGVKYLPDKKVDVLFVTLNKSDKDYSPTTMYHDYSINDTLFHWQSQSTTADTSKVGQRYIGHRNTDNKILLFVRDTKTDPILKAASSYTFLGPVNYLKHDGSLPMNITWHLDHPIPAKFLKKTNKLVTG